MGSGLWQDQIEAWNKHYYTTIADFGQIVGGDTYTISAALRVFANAKLIVLMPLWYKLMPIPAHFFSAVESAIRQTDEGGGYLLLLLETWPIRC
jgi:hypothetical protein